LEIGKGDMILKPKDFSLKSRDCYMVFKSQTFSFTG